ncbi:hypothetical protein EDB92DRAFT_1995017 [Lactarius akahatsu]|uniref:Uncharacterized protein n=1 Tax=Lactarius akahatsu TaxID=416441 RepID=A0AAD4LGE3_9AGAM|nr:hypothetical protein EDB92DRAFT_1995017 [Lactarius akahatsu]
MALGSIDDLQHYRVTCRRRRATPRPSVNGHAEQRLQCATSSQGDDPRDPLRPELSSVPPQRAQPHSPGRVFARHRFSRANRRSGASFLGHGSRRLARAHLARSIEHLHPPARPGGERMRSLIGRRLGRGQRPQLAGRCRVANGAIGCADRRVVLGLRLWTRRRRIRRRRGERAVTAGASRWEEGLVLGSDRPYTQDIEKQRGVIAGYLDTVDEVFGGRKSVEARWCPTLRWPLAGAPHDGSYLGPGNMLDSMRNLVVMEEPEGLQTVVEEDGNEDEGDSDDETSGMDDDDLPRWARWSAFPDYPLMRTCCSSRDVDNADNGGAIQQRTLAAARQCSDHGRTRAVTTKMMKVPGGQQRRSGDDSTINIINDEIGSPPRGMATSLALGPSAMDVQNIAPPLNS